MPVMEGFEVENNLPTIQGESPVPSQERGEFAVRLKAADQTVVLSIPLNPRTSKGVTNTLVLAITGKAGGQPTTVDIEFFDTDTPAEMIASSEKSIFKVTGIVVDAAVPQLLFSQLLTRSFSLKGALSRMGCRLSYAGGDGATDYEFNIQVNGERR